MIKEHIKDVKFSEITMWWSSNFAYAVGLLTADGCLSSDGRHIDFTSKDKEQVLNFMRCLDLKNRIGKKTRAQEKIKRYYRVQFGNVKLYSFLCSVGLSPKKSLTIKKVDIPSEFFADFLRGLFDGDGSFRVFSHPESQYPQLRVSFVSGSPKFIKWLRYKINQILGIKGFVMTIPRAERLEYAIADSLRLLNFMYYAPDIVCLDRKFQKVRPYLKRT